jgi:prepilin-type N-terminal cleavage/methylation domain-containing protein/prepilin-type processing-associated H-X9-DG protein
MRFCSRPQTRAPGFTLLELVCTIAIIALLAALLLPVLEKGQAAARRISCASNLKQAGTAFHIWAHEHGGMFPMQVPAAQQGTLEFARNTALSPDISHTFRHFQALSNELAQAKVLHCPADKRRQSASNFETLDNGNVSYWINPASRFGDTDSPIAGDRNVRTSGRNEWTYLQVGPADRVEFSAELHGHRGNVLFADAHVSLLDAVMLRAAFAGANAADTVLSLPAADATSTTTPGNAATSASGPTGLAEVNQASNNRRAAAEADPSEATASAGADKNRPPSPASASQAREQPGRSLNPEAMVITRLDGTTVTSSVPARAHREALDASMSEDAGDTSNPVLEFVQWLTKISAKGTYWLLLLLLLALVALEFARRRARRQRKKS